MSGFQGLERVPLSAHPRPPQPQVPEIIQYICHGTRGVTEPTAQATIRELLGLLACTYTDEVIQVFFKIQDQSRRWAARGLRRRSFLNVSAL